MVTGEASSGHGPARQHDALRLTHGGVCGDAKTSFPDQDWTLVYSLVYLRFANEVQLFINANFEPLLLCLMMLNFSRSETGHRTE